MTTHWRILAIDDDPGTLELITMALEGSYDLVTLSNPIVALDVAKLVEPDLILLDLLMPKVDGFHVLDVFRRDNALKHIPVMILSAKKTKRDIQYGYQVGATLYLTKPFQPSRLRRNIDFFFEHNQPTKRQKHRTFNQVQAQIVLLRSYRDGSVAFPGLKIKETLPETTSSSKGGKAEKESTISMSSSESESPEEQKDTPVPTDSDDDDRMWID